MTTAKKKNAFFHGVRRPTRVRLGVLFRLCLRRRPRVYQTVGAPAASATHHEALCRQWAQFSPATVHRMLRNKFLEKKSTEQEFTSDVRHKHSLGNGRGKGRIPCAFARPQSSCQYPRILA